MSISIEPCKSKATFDHPHPSPLPEGEGALCCFTSKPLYTNTASQTSIHEIYQALVVDEQRNQLILDDIKQALAEGRSPIVLTERREHVLLLAENIKDFAKNVFIMQGGMGVRQRKQLQDAMQSIPDGEERVIIATGRYLGEGFDDARLDTLFLVMPVSWKGTLAQYVGRLHRLHHAKTEVRIYDYVDSNVPMLNKMSEKRKIGYKSLGYTIIDSRL